MGAWADLELSAERVHQAHPTFPGVAVFGSGAERTFEFVPGVDPAVPEAKARVAACLGARLGRYATAYGSPEGLLDAIADDERLASSVQTVLAYAHIETAQFSGRNTSRDVYAGDAEGFGKRLSEACAAVANTAPAVLGLTATAAPGQGGALASIYV